MTSLENSSLTPPAGTEGEESCRRKGTGRHLKAPPRQKEDALRVRAPPNGQEGPPAESSKSQKSSLSLEAASPAISDDHDLAGSENNPMSASASGEPRLDSQTLDHVSQFIDKLHHNNNKEETPRASNALRCFSSDDDSQSAIEESMGKFLSVLSNDDEELAEEFGQIMSQTTEDSVDHFSPETLMAIGNYIDAAVAKNNQGLEAIAENDVLPDEDNEMLQAIADFIDTAQKAKVRAGKKSTDEGSSLAVSSSSSSLSCQNGDVQASDTTDSQDERILGILSALAEYIDTAHRNERKRNSYLGRGSDDSVLENDSADASDVLSYLSICGRTDSSHSGLNSEDMLELLEGLANYIDATQRERSKRNRASSAETSSSNQGASSSSDQASAWTSEHEQENGVIMDILEALAEFIDTAQRKERKRAECDTTDSDGGGSFDEADVESYIESIASSRPGSVKNALPSGIDSDEVREMLGSIAEFIDAAQKKQKKKHAESKANRDQENPAKAPSERGSETNLETNSTFRYNLEAIPSEKHDFAPLRSGLFSEDSSVAAFSVKSSSCARKEVTSTVREAKPESTDEAVSRSQETAVLLESAPSAGNTSVSATDGNQQITSLNQIASEETSVAACSPGDDESPVPLATQGASLAGGSTEKDRGVVITKKAKTVLEGSFSMPIEAAGDARRQTTETKGIGAPSETSPPASESILGSRSTQRSSSGAVSSADLATAPRASNSSASLQDENLCSAFDGDENLDVLESIGKYIDLVQNKNRYGSEATSRRVSAVSPGAAESSATDVSGSVGERIDRNNLAEHKNNLRERETIGDGTSRPSSEDADIATSLSDEIPEVSEIAPETLATIGEYIDSVSSSQRVSSLQRDQSAPGQPCTECINETSESVETDSHEADDAQVFPDKLPSTGLSSSGSLENQDSNSFDDCSEDDSVTELVDSLDEGGMLAMCANCSDVDVSVPEHIPEVTDFSPDTLATIGAYIDSVSLCKKDSLRDTAVRDNEPYGFELNDGGPSDGETQSVIDGAGPPDEVETPSVTESVIERYLSRLASIPSEGDNASHTSDIVPREVREKVATLIDILSKEKLEIPHGATDVAPSNGDLDLSCGDESSYRSVEIPENVRATVRTFIDILETKQSVGDDVSSTNSGASDKLRDTMGTFIDSLDHESRNDRDLPRHLLQILLDSCSRDSRARRERLPDPPLQATPSEEERALATEPERNPAKASPVELAGVSSTLRKCSSNEPEIPDAHNGADRQSGNTTRTQKDLGGQTEIVAEEVVEEKKECFEEEVCSKDVATVKKVSLEIEETTPGLSAKVASHTEGEEKEPTGSEGVEKESSRSKDGPTPSSTDEDNHGKLAVAIEEATPSLTAKVGSLTDGEEKECSGSEDGPTPSSADEDNPIQVAIATARVIRSSTDGDENEASPRSLSRDDQRDDEVMEITESDSDPEKQTLSKPLQYLSSMLLGIKTHSSADVEKIGLLVSFAYPRVNGRSPSSTAVSRIMDQARDLNIPLVAADRFLALVQSLAEEDDQVEIEMAPSDELITIKAKKKKPFKLTEVSGDPIDQFIVRLVEAGEEDQRFSFLEDTDNSEYVDDIDDIDIHFTQGSSDAEAIEMDFLTESIDKLSSSNTENVTRNPTAGSEASMQSSLRDDSSSDQGKAIHDIDDFWNRHRQTQIKRFGCPRKTIASNKRLAEEGSFSQSDISWPMAISSSGSYESMAYGWSRKQLMAEWKQGLAWWPQRKDTAIDVGEPTEINAVAATARLFTTGPLRRRSQYIPRADHWKRTYKDRTENHSGFFGVHVNSLIGASTNRSKHHSLDKRPWEHRVVKQRFLHETSVSFRRNWFGVLLPVGGNREVQQPVCSVTSMPMPVRAGEWIEEWYSRPWDQPADMSPRGSVLPSSSRSLPSQRSHQPYMDPFVHDDLDDSVWDDVPECGRIRNVKLKIGERISRVTPNLTSSLRRSRWRKKHFPRGTFPY